MKPTLAFLCKLGSVQSINEHTCKACNSSAIQTLGVFGLKAVPVTATASHELHPVKVFNSKNVTS